MVKFLVKNIANYPLVRSLSAIIILVFELKFKNSPCQNHQWSIFTTFY